MHNAAAVSRRRPAEHSSCPLFPSPPFPHGPHPQTLTSPATLAALTTLPFPAYSPSLLIPLPHPSILPHITHPSAPHSRCASPPAFRTASPIRSCVCLRRVADRRTSPTAPSFPPPAPHSIPNPLPSPSLATALIFKSSRSPSRSPPSPRCADYRCLPIPTYSPSTPRTPPRVHHPSSRFANAYAHPFWKSQGVTMYLTPPTSTRTHGRCATLPVRDLAHQRRPQSAPAPLQRPSSFPSLLPLSPCRPLIPSFIPSSHPLTLPPEPLQVRLHASCIIQLPPPPHIRPPTLDSRCVSPDARSDHIHSPRARCFHSLPSLRPSSSPPLLPTPPPNPATPQPRYPRCTKARVYLSTYPI
ncbi:hypothetical protein DFH06DRAFT_1473651 [Mycena polygramma]|nr:hypothetical protein DFH06DRAFT_1473651 [Mycena polygramma]